MLSVAFNSLLLSVASEFTVEFCSEIIVDSLIVIDDRERVVGRIGADITMAMSGKTKVNGDRNMTHAETTANRRSKSDTEQ